MAKNWKPVEAVEAIKAFDKEAIRDIGYRFPLFNTLVSRMIGASADETFMMFLQGLPEYVTVRQLETRLRNGSDSDGAVDPEEDAPVEEKPAKKAEKPSKKAPVADDEDEDEDDDEEPAPKKKAKAAKEPEKPAKKSKKPAVEDDDDDDEEDEEPAPKKSKKAPEPPSKEKGKDDKKKSKKAKDDDDDDDEDWDI